MKITLSKTTIAGCVLFCCSTVYAEPQEAHVHGLATLTFALEGDTLEIQFESPSANLIGFEHAAKTEQQKARVNKTKSVLEAPQKLFTFDGSACEIKNSDIDITAVMSDTHDKDKHDEHSHKESGHDDHGHHDKEEDHKEHNDDHHKDDHEHHDKEEDHKEHNDDHHEDDHDHAEHEDGHHKDSHSEIDAHYQFTCEGTDQLKSISIGLFTFFPGIEKIDAMWVTESSQGSDVLTATKSTLRLN